MKRPCVTLRSKLTRELYNFDNERWYINIQVPDRNDILRIQHSNLNINPLDEHDNLKVKVPFRYKKFMVKSDVSMYSLKKDDIVDCTLQYTGKWTLKTNNITGCTWSLVSISPVDQASSST